MQTTNWLGQDVSSGSVKALLEHSPVLQEKYEAFFASFRDDGLVPARVLAVCEYRIACIHGVTWPSAELEDPVCRQLEAGALHNPAPLEAAALAVAEKIPFAPHAIEDAEVAALRTHLGEPGCVSLLAALAFYDVHVRLHSVFTEGVQ